jgi:hypothetical protein
MRHLNAVEIVDLVEGRLAPERAAHPDVCAQCAALVNRTREAAAHAAVGGEVPEPSPLFWEHLSGRVREAIDREPVPVPTRWRGGLRIPGWAWAAAAMALVIGSAAIWRGLSPASPASVPAAVGRAPGGLPAASPGPDLWDEDVEADRAWAVVRAVAEDIDWDETSEAEIAARPHAAERVVPQLSSVERAELVRVIEEELRRNGA